MAVKKEIFTSETFRFFRDLGRNNHKAWMDENRERYREHVVAPFHCLHDSLATVVRKLHPGFSIGGRSGENFSRINRDIRFASDKTPYRTQMYLFFSRSEAPGRAGGQLYVGLSAEAVTIGFRIYYESRQSAMACVCAPRAMKNLAWLSRQEKKFAREYESYWYSNVRGEWKKHSGWPGNAREWKKAKGWIVRKRFRPAFACRPDFLQEVEKIFHEIFPLYCFSCLPE